MNNFKFIKSKLSLDEATGFIRQVVRSYFDFDEDGNIVGYTPYFGELTLKIKFLRYYTDYTFSDDPQEDYANICDLDVYEHCEHFSYAQFEGIVDAINHEVEVKREIYINSQNGMTRLLNSISNIVESIDVSKFDFEKANEFMSKFNKSDLNAKDIINTYLQSDEYKSEKEKQLTDVIDSKNVAITAMKNQMKQEIVNELKSDLQIARGASNKVVQMKG